MERTVPTATQDRPGRLPALHNRFADRLGQWFGHDLIALAARFGIAGTFWLSGRTKVEGTLSVSENAVALFEEEYRLPLLSPDAGRDGCPSIHCCACADTETTTARRHRPRAQLRQRLKLAGADTVFGSMPALRG